MARPRKQFASAAERKAHDARLAKRRATNHEARTLAMASKASEGQSDFSALVAAEQDRITRLSKSGGAASPKAVTRARENLTSAFDLMGGVAALVVWGRENPTEFYRIWARLVPKEAEENTTALPLETLLAKLASREDQTVADAAIAIGHEVLDAAREQVELEDAGLRPNGETIQ